MRVLVAGATGVLGRWVVEQLMAADHDVTAVSRAADRDRLRTEASRTLVDAALTAGASRYVQESIRFLYADAGERWIDESAPVAPEGPTAAVVAALDAPAGVYNVAEDDPAPRHEHAAALSDVLDRPVRLPPAVVGSLPPLRVKSRSQRISNRRLQERTAWSPRRPSMRERWTTLLPELRSAAES